MGMCDSNISHEIKSLLEQVLKGGLNGLVLKMLNSVVFDSYDLTADDAVPELVQL
jgi:hypothetical protein